MPVFFLDGEPVADSVLGRHAAAGRSPAVPSMLPCRSSGRGKSGKDRAETKTDEAAGKGAVADAPSERGRPQARSGSRLHRSVRRETLCDCELSAAAGRKNQSVAVKQEACQNWNSSRGKAVAGSAGRFVA